MRIIKTLQTLGAAFVMLAGTALAVSVDSTPSRSWSELSEMYELPSWFAEGKLGVWVHWGPQAVPAKGGGWYARNMYMHPDIAEPWGRDAFYFHREHFGHQADFGYKDILNEWKTPQLDTDKVVNFARDILGARYFVALAVHHDRFDLWDSSHHNWNSVNIGPKRDIIGEFAASTRKAGLPFGVSTHDDRFQGWFYPAFGSDTYGPRKGEPYDGRMTAADGVGKWWEGLDPAELYGLPTDRRTPGWETATLDAWLKRHIELLEKYDVDLLWMDGWNFPYNNQGYGRRLAEWFFNRSLEKHGTIEAVLCGKPRNLSPDDQQGFVWDFEKGVPPASFKPVFQSITTPQYWFRQHDDPNIRPSKDARVLAETFADVLSKGGNMLLNIELMADGGFPQSIMSVYEEFGAWVRLNSEAIYGSSRWETIGDNLRMGAKRINLSETALEDISKMDFNFNERDVRSRPYAHDEVRFTRRGDKLYIFVLNPAAGPIDLPSLGTGSQFSPGAISSIRLLGGEITPFRQTDKALTIEIPEQRPNALVSVFEVSGAL
jgi:alpha-L-fucosidase